MDNNTLIRNLARESYEKGNFTGTWLYAEGGKIVSVGAVGFRDSDDTLPVTEDTVFQLASVTKQFTAAAVMLLVRDGRLSLEDDVTKFFPELTAYKGAAVRHLLTHTGGVPDYFGDMDWFIKIWKEEKRVPSNPEIVRFLSETKLGPEFAPGDGFEYSNTGYNLLAEIVERVSGEKFEDFLKTHIFEPAGMTSTRAYHIRRDGIPFENFAHGMAEENGRYIPAEDTEEYADVTALDGLNGDDYVYSNVFDMLAWDRALRAGSVLTLEEQKLMYTPAKLNGGGTAGFGEDEGYGFGWCTASDPDHGLIVSHGGGMPGVITWFERFVDEDKTVVILSSREPTDYRAWKGLSSGIGKIARGEEPDPVITIEDIAVKEPDRSLWESWCGRYEHPEDADFTVDEITMKDGELYAKAIDDGEVLNFRLYPLGDKTFGRKGGMVEIEFGDGCLTVDGVTEKKIK